MSRRLDFILPIIIFCSLLLTIFHSQDTYAYDWNIYNNCISRSGSGGAIDGHRWACDICAARPWNSLIGAIWIAQSNTGSERFSNIIYVPKNVSTVPVYVMGDILSCQSVSYFSYNYAMNVSVDKSYITLTGNRLYRGNNVQYNSVSWNYHPPLGPLYTSSSPGASDYILGYLNVNTFKQQAPIVNGKIYQDTVNISRCYSNTGTGCTGSMGTNTATVIADYTAAEPTITYETTYHTEDFYMNGSISAFIDGQERTWQTYNTASGNIQVLFRSYNSGNYPLWCTVDGVNTCSGPWNSGTGYTYEYTNYTLSYGQTINACRSLNYHRRATITYTTHNTYEDGVLVHSYTIASDPAYSELTRATACVTLSRPTQTNSYYFQATNRAIINGVDYTNQDYYPESEYTDVSFVHQVYPSGSHFKNPRWRFDGGVWNYSSQSFTDVHTLGPVSLGQRTQFCKNLAYSPSIDETVSAVDGTPVSSNYSTPTTLSACLYVNHEYNYKTTPATNFGNLDTPLYGGDPSPIQIAPTVKNTKEDPNRPATQTQSGTIQVVQLIVPANQDYNQNSLTGTGDENSDTTTTQDPCTYYRSSDKLTANATCSQAPGSPINDIIIPKNSTWSGSQFSIPIPDYPVGTKVCVAAGFTPAKSSSAAWRISDASCRTIAKKPHYEVWGGHLYTAGNITTSTTVKRINDINYLFGSWTEYALIAGGTVQGLSSGATTGYTTRYNDQGGKILGQELNDNFCSRSPLSIANNECSTFTGHSGIYYDNSTADRIISRFTKTPTDPPPTSINPCTTSGCTSYTSIVGDLTINSAPTLQKGVTHIIYATGNITINTNILASSDSTTFGRISELPQYLIISNKDIRINPHVARVDSWLVTKGGTVNTCHHYLIGSSDPATSLSSNVCNSQLRINGPILAKSITPYRTYGSNQGFSATPSAEIFNLHPSSILWAYQKAISRSQAFTTYLKEAGPRY